MKKQELNDLKEKTINDLAKKVKGLKRELTQSVLELKMEKTKNVHEVNTKRKDIAKIKTIMKLKSFEKSQIKKEREK